MKAIVIDGRVPLGWVLAAGALGIAVALIISSPRSGTDVSLDPAASSESLESTQMPRGARVAVSDVMTDGALAEGQETGAAIRSANRSAVDVSYASGASEERIARIGRQR